ncbi:MAG TPA: DNA-formamidopyrimidine glycosylase family protein [Acidimicrobiales bacterium]
MLEVEIYRRAAAAALGRRIVAVDAPDAWILKGDTTAVAVTDALLGRSFSADRRRGKLLLLDTDDHGPTLGLRFGMTGVLELDGLPAIETLEYSSHRRDPAWERFAVHFDGGGALRLRDPRRLGGVELDPDESRLGPDAAEVGAAELGRILADSQAPLKARLMDQARLAGLGNLLTDELLWRAGLDPARPAGSLSPTEVRRLHRHLRATLDELGARGGSHMGDLQEARRRGSVCPRDGAPLERRTIGGRTTYSCPRHQR